MTEQVIPEAAVEAALLAYDHAAPYLSKQNTIIEALEAAAPFIAAQVLREAVDAFPLETITAPDNAVVWLRRRADQIEAQ